uniref:Uncharacterized protein n=1 Tax=Arundo donax TaxID=35708 RepID=A0A0A9C9G4_ARUDO
MLPLLKYISLLYSVFRWKIRHYFSRKKVTS